MTKTITDKIVVGATYRLPETFGCSVRSPDDVAYRMWVTGRPLVVARCKEDGLLYFELTSDSGTVYLYPSSVDGIEEAKP